MGQVETDEAAEKESGEKKAGRVRPLLLGIDDNPVNLRAMKVFLSSKFDFIPAKSGIEGLSILKIKKVDLILLDIDMPIMSGFDFLKQMRDLPEKKEIPVICVTSHDATSEFITSVIHAGAKDYLTKPFDPNILQSKVSKMLHLNEFLLP